MIMSPTAITLLALLALAVGFCLGYVWGLDDGQRHHHDDE